MELMRGCNAFSLSQATGVPRETVRRKIKQLVKLGWIEQHNRHGLFITTRWMERLSGVTAAKALADFQATAEQIAKLTG
jgi:DNA-binding GntR family transcriptional regulator